MTINVTKYRLNPDRIFAGTRGSYGMEKLSFDFGAGWDFDTISVTFHPQSGKPIRVPYLAGAEIDIPAKVMAYSGETKFVVSGTIIGNDGEVERKAVSLEGVVDVAYTADDKGGNARKVTPDVYDQLIEQATGLFNEAREDVQRSADEAAESAQDAEGFANDAEEAEKEAKTSENSAKTSASNAAASEKAASDAAAAAKQSMEETAAIKSAAETSIEEKRRAAIDEIRTVGDAEVFNIRNVGEDAVDSAAQKIQEIASRKSQEMETFGQDSLDDISEAGSLAISDVCITGREEVDKIQAAGEEQTEVVRAAAKESMDAAAQSAEEARQAADEVTRYEPEIFWAEYGVTTYAEVNKARLANKVCMCNYIKRSLFMRLVQYAPLVFAAFDAPISNSGVWLYLLRLNEDNTWEELQPKLLQERDVVNFINHYSSDSFVPTAKAVYDAIMEYGGSGGVNGKDGIGIASITQTTKNDEDDGVNILTVTLTDGSEHIFEVQNGSKGSQGEKGDPGDDYILTDEDKQEIAGRIPNGNVIVFVTGGSLERLRISAVIPPAGVSAEEAYTLIAKGLFDVIVQTYDSDDNSTGAGALRGFVGDDYAVAVGEFWTETRTALVEMRLDFVGGTVEAVVRYTSGTSSGGGSGEPMSGATANDDGTGGTVPAPMAGQQDAVLHGDGTWREIEIPAKTSELANDSGFITKTAADLVNYYTKSQTYTQAEVNALVSAIPKFAISVVSVLPTANISETTVYLVKSGESGDLYTEYIYVGGAWEILGSQRVDLTGYATETWVNTKLADYLPAAQLQLAINTALAQAKESGEFDGEPGVSPTVSVSAITGGHRITITDKNGTKTVDVMDGADGDPGDPGRGIVSVARTSGTGAPGTTDTYTITYTDNTTSTFGVYNGKDGEPYTLTSADKTAIAQEAAGLVDAPAVDDTLKVAGAAADAAKVGKELSSLSETIADKVSKTGITLGLHSDGKYYVFVDGAPVGTGFELSGNSSDVFGYVDENNNIVLNGNLADGSYNIKYEMEDGSTVDIGNLVLDSNVYYTVTNNLTNCTNSNSDIEAIGGQAYSATITANDGYSLSSVVVTMGGTDVSASAVSGGIIIIAEVTGNIVITAVAEEPDVEITNWIEEVGYTTDTRLSLSSGNTTGASGYECTGFIPAKYGDVLYIENVDLTEENATNIIFYDSEKNQLAVNGSYYGVPLYYLFVTEGTQTGDVYSSTLEVKGGALSGLLETFDGFIRIGSKSITAESVFNIKRDGVWL